MFEAEDGIRVYDVTGVQTCALPICAASERATRHGVKHYWHGAYGLADKHPARQMDLAVFPSLCRETYGLVVDEALHHGTPVVVPDIGALPERSDCGRAEGRRVGEECRSRWSPVS